MEGNVSETKISLSLTANYARTWGTWEGVRELVQNWHDGLYELNDNIKTVASQEVTFVQDTSNSRFIVYSAFLRQALTQGHGECNSLGHIIMDKYNGKLHLINKHTSLHKRILLLGYSKKALTSNVIGQFGEGLKIGALALVREGRIVIMETSEDLWMFELCHDNNFGEKVLTVLITERTSLESDRVKYNTVYEDIPVVIECKDTVTTVAISLDEWKQYKSRFLFLHPPKDEVKSEIGSLLLDNIYAGQLYVKGVWMSDLSAEDLSTGVNFVNLRIDRDRNAVPKPSEIDHMVSCMWGKALESRPQLINVYYQLLKNGMSRDVKQALEYANDNLARMVAEEFLRVHGSDVFAVSTMATQQDLEQVRQQLQKQVVICNDTLLKLLYKSGKHRSLEEELLNVTTPKQSLYPIQSLNAEERSVLDHSLGLLRLGYPDITLSVIDIINTMLNTEGCVKVNDRIHIPLWMLRDYEVGHVPSCDSEALTQCMCRESRIVCSILQTLHSAGEITPLPSSCIHRLLHIMAPLAKQVCQKTQERFCSEIHIKFMNLSQTEADHSLCIDREKALQDEMTKLKENIAEITEQHQSNLSKLKYQVEKTEKELMGRETEAINIEQRLRTEIENTVHECYKLKLHTLECEMERLTSRNIQLKQEVECWTCKLQELERQLAESNSAKDRQHDTFLEEMMYYVDQCKSRTKSVQKLCAEKLEDELLESEAKGKLDLLLTLSTIISEDLQKDKFLCTVCLMKRKDVLLVPCGHYNMCDDCAQQVIGSTRQCPVCKTLVQKVLKVYG